MLEMIDTRKNLILINGAIRTAHIESCKENSYTNKYDVVFKGNPKVYTYAVRHVVWLKNPTKLSPENYRIKSGNIHLRNIVCIYVFNHYYTEYWHIVYNNGYEKDYKLSDLTISKSCLDNEESQNILKYFERIAAENQLKDDEGIPLLLKQYKQIDFIDDNCAAGKYLKPKNNRLGKQKYPTLIYPFGCNKSQKKAVKRAFENQISIIQGPPGTGKTQTILNIIVNLLCQNKTVLVVSNNNSAIENIEEKLEKDNLGFLAAHLGSSEKKSKFVEAQKTAKHYPENMISWKDESVESRDSLDEIKHLADELNVVFEKQERLAKLKQEHNDLLVEQKHYKEEFAGLDSDYEIRESMTSKRLMNLWQESQRTIDRQQEISSIKEWWHNLLLKIKSRYIFKSGSQKYILAEASEQVRIIQTFYYDTRLKELKEEIEFLEKTLVRIDTKSMLNDLKDMSFRYFRNRVYLHYAENEQRPIFTLVQIKKDTQRFLQEYPVILSTTFSARYNFGKDVMFDYVIMDESSQVSSDTGFLALTCAKNAVVVGDSMQLPNVVTEEDKEKFDLIAKDFNIPKEYDCGKFSFLESLCGVIPDIPQTLLKEHYRCHPKIIDFCNKKFYGGELVIMTENNNDENVISAIKTVKGNHSRNKMNQREIDVIKQEVLPEMNYPENEIGIIAPYNSQVDALQKNLEETFDIATIHKFQGREKDAIIMSLVDDRISSFSDNPNLLNVAISRAKKHFCLVVTGNELPNCNVKDLLGYIEYNNFAVEDSKIRSIFDYLYKQYTDARIEFLQNHDNISEYASENLTYALLTEILASDTQFKHLDVICHQPLRLLIRDWSLMSEDEEKYARRSGTHLDFLIYNKVSKRAVLVVETDGYAYHKAGERQAERDALKNQILAKYSLPLLRLSTTGSDEKQRVENKLREILS